jgi:hypothetical protein
MQGWVSWLVGPREKIFLARGKQTVGLPWLGCLVTGRRVSFMNPIKAWERKSFINRRVSPLATVVCTERCALWRCIRADVSLQLFLPQALDQTHSTNAEHPPCVELRIHLLVSEPRSFRLQSVRVPSVSVQTTGWCHWTPLAVVSERLRFDVFA